MSELASEIASGDRFEFGANWARFLRLLNETRIQQAQQSLRRMLGVENFEGLRFLDAGSGSGLFSLAAKRLGASVHSFDYDPRSVACTETLKRRYFPDDAGWRVESGSVLDKDYLAGLGQFDVVYSWGVLHHTGRMHDAIENVAGLVRPGGSFFIALYNDQGWISKYWLAVKRAFNANPVARALLILIHTPYLLGVPLALRALRGKLQLDRGMSPWHDMLDWLGGLPFEVARPAAVIASLEARGFKIRHLRGVGRRHGCNEFVFSRVT